MNRLFVRNSTLALWSCLALFLIQCTSPTTTSPTRCSTQSDCPTGKRCIGQVCKDYVERNDPPIANAGKNQRVRQGSTVTLDGTASSDPDGDTITYAWLLADKPKDSKAELQKAEEDKPSFVPDAPGKYILELTVTDEKGNRSDPDTVSITVYGADQNGDPIANAGIDQIVGVGSQVTLDGSGSNDPEGDKLTYKWTIKSKPDGSTATLTSPDGAKPSFTADKLGKFVIELIVNDGLEDSAPDTVSIEAIDDINLVPTLTSATPKEGFTDTTVKVTLDGQSFSQNARILFDNRTLPTDKVRFVSASKLEADLTLTLRPGVYPLKVRNPNGKTTDSVDFTVKDIPTPALTKIDPNAGTTGTKIDVTLTGTGFVPSTELLLQTTPVKINYKSETEITANLDLTNILPGTYKISVRNTGGRTSNTVDFNVLPPGPPPVLKVINPPFGLVGKQIPFSVHGTGFSPGAVIIFDGKAIASDRIRRDEIRAKPHLDLSQYQPGDYKVWVRNPDGQESKEKETFTIEALDPVPAIDRILPFFVYLDDATNTLAVYGKNFRAGSKFFVGTNEIPTADINVRSSTYIEVKVDTTKGTWTVGDVDAYAVSPSGKASNKFKVSISYREPTLSGLTPSGWNTKCDVDVDVYGNNFIAKSELLFGSTKYTTTDTTNKLTLISDKQMRFRLPATKLSPTTYQVRVQNGPSQSTPVSFYLRSGSTIPTPAIREMRPASARADTKVNIQLYEDSSKGRFLQGAYVEFNGKKQKSSCSSTSSTYCGTLTAEVDLAGAKPGIASIYVINPCGSKSPPFSFYVDEPPTPFIAGFTPTFVEVGAKTKITIKGVDISPKHKLNWGGQVIPTTFISDKEIVTTNDIDFTNAQPGTIDVKIDNGNGKVSQTVKFAVLDKAQTLRITNMTNTEFERGTTYNGVFVGGQGFTQTTKLFFNGQAVATAYTNAQQLTASGLDFTTLPAGIYYLVAKDGTKESNPFPVLAKPTPPPTINYLRLYDVYANRASGRMYIYGSGFCKPTSGTRCPTPYTFDVEIVDANGKNHNANNAIYKITSAYNSSSPYTYGTLDATKMPPGEYKVYFKLKTGEKSNPAILNLQKAPPPEITSFSPAFAIHNKTTTIRVYGRYFDRGAVALIGLQTLPTTYSSATYLRITIAANSLPIGSHDIKILNPDKSISAPKSLSIIGSGIAITRLLWSPSTAYAGKVYSYLRVYGVNWTRGVLPIFTVNGQTYTATPPRTPYCYYTTSTTSESYCTLYNFSTVGLAPGKHKLKMTQSGNSSSDFSFDLQKPPPPNITDLSPDYAPKDTTQRITISGTNFSSGAIVLVGLQIFTTTCSSSSCTRLYVDLNTTGLSIGTHKIIVQNPDKQNSNSVDFTVLPVMPPLIYYTSPDVVSPGQSTTFSVYGKNFVSGATATVNGQSVSVSSVTDTRVSIGTSTLPNQGPYTIQITNPNGRKSNIYNLGLRGLNNKPYIRYTSPTYLYSSTSTRTIYAYGFGFDSSAYIEINGVPQQSTVSTTSVRCSYVASATTVTDLNIVVKNGSGAASNTVRLSILPSSSYTPRVTSLRRTSVRVGETFASGYFYVYGSGFTQNSKVEVDGKQVPTRYSTTTRLYIDQAFDFTKAKPGHMYFRVVDGTKRSNDYALRIETYLIQGYRERINSITPYWGREKTTIPISLSASYITSSNAANYELLVKGKGIPAAGKVFPLIYSAGWKATLDSNGWSEGIYTIQIRNKVTQDLSGGSGFAIIASSPCPGGGQPTTETCNGKDDDCDGSVDEDYPDKGKACTAGTGPCQATGTYKCKADGTGLECSAQATQTSPEVCDGKDNDCDGTVDEGLTRQCWNSVPSNYGCRKQSDGTYKCNGICTAGTQTCSAGVWGTCTGQVGYTSEKCNNGKDDDCDGQVDEASCG